MLGERKERWQELCEQAINEHDPHKFSALIDEINRLLEDRERLLHSGNPPKPSTTPKPSTQC